VTSVTGVELLNKRVLMGGIELGRVGTHRFLPYATVLHGGDEVEVESPFVLLGRDQLDFYRRHGRPLRS
jgi:hypothetical protein